MNGMFFSLMLFIARVDDPHSESSYSEKGKDEFDQGRDKYLNDFDVFIDS